MSEDKNSGTSGEDKINPNKKLEQDKEVDPNRKELISKIQTSLNTKSTQNIYKKSSVLNLVQQFSEVFSKESDKKESIKKNEKQLEKQLESRRRSSVSDLVRRFSTPLEEKSPVSTLKPEITQSKVSELKRTISSRSLTDFLEDAISRIKNPEEKPKVLEKFLITSIEGQNIPPEQINKILVYCQAYGRNSETLIKRLKLKIDEFRYRANPYKKIDGKYPVMILAEQGRDDLVEELKEEMGLNYPDLHSEQKYILSKITQIQILRNIAIYNFGGVENLNQVKQHADDLVNAIRLGDVENFEKLFYENQPKAHEWIKNNINTPASTKTGNTLLHMAAKSGNQTIITALVKNGADLLVKNPEGQTPLEIAAANGNDIAFIFLQNKLQEKRLEKGVSDKDKIEEIIKNAEREQYFYTKSKETGFPQGFFKDVIDVCVSNGAMISFRPMDAGVKKYLEEGAIMKMTDIKGKSASDPMLQYLVPYEQVFSKLSSKGEFDKIGVFQAKNDSALMQEQELSEKIKKYTKLLNKKNKAANRGEDVSTLELELEKLKKQKNSNAKYISTLESKIKELKELESKLEALKKELREDHIKDAYQKKYNVEFIGDEIRVLIPSKAPIMFEGKQIWGLLDQDGKAIFGKDGNMVFFIKENDKKIPIIAEKENDEFVRKRATGAKLKELQDLIEDNPNFKPVHGMAYKRAHVSKMSDKNFRFFKEEKAHLCVPDCDKFLVAAAGDVGLDNEHIKPLEEIKAFWTGENIELQKNSGAVLKGYDTEYGNVIGAALTAITKTHMAITHGAEAGNPNPECVAGKHVFFIPDPNAAYGANIKSLETEQEIVDLLNDLIDKNYKFPVNKNWGWEYIKDQNGKYKLKIAEDRILYQDYGVNIKNMVKDMAEKIIELSKDSQLSKDDVEKYIMGEDVTINISDPNLQQYLEFAKEKYSHEKSIFKKYEQINGIRVEKIDDGNKERRINDINGEIQTLKLNYAKNAETSYQNIKDKPGFDHSPEHAAKDKTEVYTEKMNRSYINTSKNKEVNKEVKQLTQDETKNQEHQGQAEIKASFNKVKNFQDYLKFEQENYKGDKGERSR